MKKKKSRSFYFDEETLLALDKAFIYWLERQEPKSRSSLVCDAIKEAYSKYSYIRGQDE